MSGIIMLNCSCFIKLNVDVTIFLANKLVNAVSQKLSYRYEEIYSVINMKTTTSLSSSAWKKDRLKLCLTGTRQYGVLEESY